MARPPIRNFVCPDKTLEKGLNALVDELNRLGKMEVSGAAFSNGPEGPKIAFDGTGGAGLVLALISPSGLLPRTGTSPDFTLGTGLATRYDLSPPAMTLGSTAEAVWNPYPVAVDGPVDAWFFEAPGGLVFFDFWCP